MKIGIIGAMFEEVALLRDTMCKQQEHKLAGRIFYEGTMNDFDAILVLAKIGKVAAAITTTVLIKHFDVDAIIFTGVAGALDPTLNIGDVVIAENLVQHDMDASPIFPKYQIPLLNLTNIESSKKLTKCLALATNDYLCDGFGNDLSKDKLEKFYISNPKVNYGTIVSGDQFIKSSDIVNKIRNDIAFAKCVEMEGAAVAQVCYEFGVPFAILRVISDKADHSAPIDFTSFLAEIASYYSRGIIANFANYSGE